MEKAVPDASHARVAPPRNRPAGRATRRPEQEPVHSSVGFRILAAALLAFASAVPARAWYVQLAGTAPGASARAYDVAVDGSGDVLVAGAMANGDKNREDFVVLRFDGTTGDEEWRQVLDGSTDDSARALAIDASGAVVAGGTLGSLVLAKFDGATGALFWSYTMDPGISSWAHEVVLDSAGNVVAAGGRVDETTRTDFTVVKVDGSTGSEIWRQILAGTETDPDEDRRDQALDVALDAAGDVFAAGYFRHAGLGKVFAVLKLDGATGAEIWRYELPPIGEAKKVALDSAGDVFAVGWRTGVGAERFFTVVKLDGATGAELWMQDLIGDLQLTNEGVDVVVGADGNAVAGGSLYMSETRDDFAVVKFDGATGTEIWRRVIPSGSVQDDLVNAVSLDGNGDVLAAGRLFRRKKGFGPGFAVAKLSGSDGSVLWLRELGASSQGLVGFDEAFAVAAGPGGEVVAGGRIDEEIGGPTVAVARFDGATGFTVDPCSSLPRTDCLGGAFRSRMALTDRDAPGPDALGRDKLVWNWVGGPTIPASELGNLNAGEDLRLCVYDRAAGTETLAMDLVVPGGGTCGVRACWKRVGPPEALRGFRYKGRGVGEAGVRKLFVRAADAPSGKIVLRARGPELSLPGPASASEYFLEDPSVTVQLVASSGLCWDVTYEGPADVNHSQRFRDRCKECS